MQPDKYCQHMIQKPPDPNQPRTQWPKRDPAQGQGEGAQVPSPAWTGVAPEQTQIKLHRMTDRLREPQNLEGHGSQGRENS